MGTPASNSKYSRENLVGKSKPSKELLKSGVKIYYSSDGCQSYKVVTIEDIFIEENKVYCVIRFDDHDNNHDTTVDIENILENSLVEKDYFDKIIESQTVSRKKNAKSACFYIYLNDPLKHLEGYPFNEGFKTILTNYHDKIIPKNTIISVASFEKNALLILDHFTKLENQIYPFGDEKYIDSNRILKYKNDFVDLVNKFNNYGPKFTIYYDKNNNTVHEVGIYNCFHNNNPSLCFAIYANIYNVVRFINNVFIEHTKNPKESVATEFGINRLVKLANYIGSNRKHYLQHSAYDFFNI
uniref:MULE domain-containing protein n=1 Tax=Strongyloides stercoralis TaxID=6248 RepID=A0A0K0DX18_STRER